MKTLIASVVFIIALLSAAQAQELKGVDIFPLDKLKPAMKGTGYTVIRGTQIQTFDVEILELVPKGGFDGGPMILAKFSGPVVEKSKGIAAGYSGSPVYIDGKLLGAVSMAIPYTDTHIGGITPISSMLPALPESGLDSEAVTSVLPPTQNNGTPLNANGEPIAPTGDQPQQAAGDPPTVQPAPDAPAAPGEQGAAPAQAGEQPSEAQPAGATKIVYMKDPAHALAFNETMRSLGLHDYAAVRAMTPVIVTGMSQEILDKMGGTIGKRLGDNFELIAEPGIGGSGVTSSGGLFLTDAPQGKSATPPGLFFSGSQAPPLKPGAAVTVSLMQGDIEMNAIGTLTYSDPDGRFLIFGHPMMGTGPTNMPLGEGYVTWTHTSIERPFKDGVRLRPVGTMTEDRGAGCGGTFSQSADMIPVLVKVKDMDLGTEKSVHFEVIRHPDFTPILVAMGLAQASQQVLDRQLGGTLKLSYHIEGAGLKEPLRRTNYYSDDANVVMNGAMELVPVSNLLETNIYRDVKITKIEVMVEITRNRTNASIDDAKIVWDKKKSDQLPSTGTPPVIGGESQPEQEAVPEIQQQSENELLSGGYRMQDDGQAPPNQQPGGQQQQVVQPGMPGILGMGPMNADMPTFSPGEEIKVRVRLQPYRTDSVWREFSIRVPDDFPSGNTMILVHGGGDLISASEVNGKGRSLFGMGPVIDVKEHDLDSILDQITQWPLNNELLVTLVRPFDPTAPQELTTTTSGGGTPAEKPADKVDAKYQMEWVIYNGFMLPVNIMTKADQEAAEKAKAAMTAGENAAKDSEQKQHPQDSGREDRSRMGANFRMPF